jgi:hypothetical protein
MGRSLALSLSLIAAALAGCSVETIAHGLGSALKPEDTRSTPVAQPDHTKCKDPGVTSDTEGYHGCRPSGEDTRSVQAAADDSGF